MRPIKLTMQAFGSYAEKTTVDFSETTENLFLVTGDTGAGKTTIFDAIVFALYGEASSVVNKKEGVLLQSQYADVDVCPEVSLTFSDGSADELYQVRRVPRHVRRLKKASAKAKPAFAATFIKLVGFVAVFLPIAVAFGFRDSELIAILVMLGSATTVSCFVMARNMGHEGVISSTTIMLTTLLSAFTLTLWLYIIKSLGLV